MTNISWLYEVIPTVLVAFALTLLLTPVIKKIAVTCNVLDVPSDRKMHNKTMPLLGGIGLYIGIMVSVFAHVELSHTMITLLIGTSLVLVMGVLDDIWGLNPLLKFLLQVSIATYTALQGIAITFISNPFSEGVVYLGWAAIPITVIWIVSIMNTINLIDGLDGLAAGITGISAGFLALFSILTHQGPASIIALAIFGACLGFLRYNFSPAKIFMGDSGAMVLGYLLSVVSIIGVLKSTIAISLLLPIIVLGLPILDTGFAIIRRFRQKKAIFKGDTDHVHHRLVKKGLTPRHATILLYGGSIHLGLVAWLISSYQSTTQFYWTLSGLIILTTLLSYQIRRHRHIFYRFFNSIPDDTPQQQDI